MTKEEFLSRLKKLNLTQKDFAKIAHIPYSTLNNWGCMANGKVIQVPSWVDPFLKHYHQSIKYDKVKKQVFNFLMDEMKERKQGKDQNKD
ncbi:helix-turn-helix domain-containing protein [Arcobacter vandammei]|uniref:helix-turn-helix domain-containing protein n=1 Tax=Arcobacter vandammei TaxID=2782243 RepID=UPI0018E04B74|nr:hypothetical protein [Arcobacter vandammei]